MIKSHETTKENEESKDSSEPPQKKEEERRRSPTPPPARRSPDPSCAICLEQLQNKSFTDSCFHMFCFTCLVEWSKVKPECPLCKKSFKSIVHNVRSFSDYDQYYINKSRISDNLLQCVAERRFRYNTTLTSDRIRERSASQADYSDILENEIASHRMRYAPHSIHSVRLFNLPQSVRRIPCSFRRRIYEEDVWVRPLLSGRVRTISPAFFRRNIACTHRLLPWLNRELLVVMPNNESQISFVIELIMALIVKYEITSPEFYTLIEPYTALSTGHFVHEFYNFAVSPYESMESYDLHARYGYSNRPDIANQASNTLVVSSPDSDVVPIAINDPTSQKNINNNSTRKKKQHQLKKKHDKECRKTKKLSMFLRRNSEKNCWESVVPYVNENDGPGSLAFELAGPSTSRGNPFQECSLETSSIGLDEVECLGGKDDDECQVLEVLKPISERTPEIVDISSDSEGPNITINVTSFDDENDNAIFNSITESIVSAPYLLSTTEEDDDDIIFVSESKVNNTSVPEKPIDYSLKNSEKETEIESKNQNVEPSSPSNKENTELEASDSKKITVLQSAVRAATNEDTGSWSPLVRPKKRKALILDDASTESCSESAQVPEIDTRVKKLKLRSVVAHFSYDPSDEHDSTHLSSLRKKHKERKKKKKKHKHKHRIYSSDSDH